MDKLVCHHVGGRSGSRGFPVLPAFEEDIISVMYDADAECTAQIAQYWQRSKSQTIVLSYCLSSCATEECLHINYDPYTSSIYKFNSHYAKWYYPSQNMDYVMGDACKQVRKVALQTKTLDEIVASGEAPAPDFLSLDTQGSELDILEGAKSCLHKSVLGVLVEVEFHPLYLNQPLFGELCEFLEPTFDLVDLTILDRLRPMRGKKGFSGGGYTTHGEALFLRKIDTIRSERGRQLHKLAFLAVVFNQFEMAQQCMEEMAYLLNDGPAYLEFISRLAPLVKELPERERKLFSDLYTEEQSRARFRANQNATFPLTGVIVTIAHALDAVAAMRTRYKKMKEWFCIRWALCFGLSEVEKLFLEYGLEKQCKILVKNRITQ